VLVTSVARFVKLGQLTIKGLSDLSGRDFGGLPLLVKIFGGPAVDASTFREGSERGSSQCRIQFQSV
jgi:hypothetical protein